MDQVKTHKIGFQGVEGSFSEQALFEYFGENVETMCFSEFEDVFDALQRDEIKYGILPIENSSTGGISEVYDLLREYSFKIVGERSVKVIHHLLGIPGTKLEEIEEVYSHPQAFIQSSNFFKTYPDWMLIPYKNTATSAKYVMEKNCKSKAAVASSKAGNLYNLEVIQPNINYNKKNVTRFIIIGKEAASLSTANKISLMVSVAHKPGALVDVLKHFSDHGLNMIKIESRPIINQSWKYYFYIDFDGNMENEVVRKSIEEIERDSVDFILLGNYKSHETQI